MRQTDSGCDLQPAVGEHKISMHCGTRTAGRWVTTRIIHYMP